MPGTLEGGKLAAQTNLRNDPQFYVKIGSMGGSIRTAKGFALNRELAKTAGALGGKISTRKGIKTGMGKKHQPVKLTLIQKLKGLLKW